MKRLIAIILAVCTCMSLYACGGNFKNAEVQKADELILAIGEVSLENESAIFMAKAYYDTLSDEQKAQVENSAVLEAAVQSLESLKLEHQYATAVSYENEKNPMAAKAIYDSLPQDYKDVAQRVAKIDGFLSLEGTWVCDNVNAVGSNGKTYKPRYDRYDVFIIPGWKIVYNGWNLQYSRGRLPFETTIEAMNGIAGFQDLGIWMNEEGLYEVGGHGIGGSMNGGFQKLDMYMYFDAENQTLKVVYVAGYTVSGKDVTIEYTYHKK